MGLDSKIAHHQLCYELIGVGMKIHRALKPGLRKVAYQNALELEFGNLGVRFEREYRHEVYYQDQPIGLYYLDFLVEDAVVVELKAFSHFLTQAEVAQCLRYMQATKAPVGLLINFGRPQLDYKRILPPKSWQPINYATDPWLRSEGYK